MLLLRLLEFVFVVISLVFVATQVIWPMLRGTQPFPLLRRERRLENEIAAARQKQLEEDLEEKVRRNGRRAS